MFFQLFLLGGLVKFPWKCVCVCLPCEFGGRVPVAEPSWRNVDQNG